MDAAERLLSLIARSRDLSQRAAAGKPGNSNRSVALEQAQIALALRQRRVRFFDGSFSAEPPAINRGPFHRRRAARSVGGRANDMRADRAGQLLQIVLVGRRPERVQTGRSLCARLAASPSSP